MATTAFNFSKYRPHLLIVAGFFLLAILFNMPAFQGKELSQHDNISWKAMSEEARAWHAKTGENTLWSNSMFGGMPTYTYYVPESNNLLTPVYNFVTSLLPKPANFFILAMLSFYALVVAMRLNRWVGAAGAVAFAFSTYNPVIISAGHETKMIAIALMPAVLAGMFLLYRGRYLSGGALFAASLAFVLMSAHYQIGYYLGIVLVVAGLGFFIQAIRKGTVGRFAKATAVAVLGAALAVGVSAQSILPTSEFNAATMRGGKSELTLNQKPGETKKKGGLDKDYAFLWSNGIGETATLLIPDLYGGGSGEDADRFPKTNEMLGERYEKLPGYWGPQPFVTGADHYIGAVVCFLAVLGLFVIRSRHKWWMAAASLIAIAMSWGKHLPGFNYFLFDTLPLLKNFRTPSMVLVVPQLLAPVLGVWGLSELLSGTVDRSAAWKAIRNAAGITVGLCVVLGVLGSFFFDFTNPTSDAQLPAEALASLKDDRAALARNSALLSSFYIAAMAAALWAWSRGMIRQTVVTIIAAALLLIDLLPVGARYLNEENYSEPDEYSQNFQPRAVDKEILQDKDPYYRVLDLTRDPYNDAVPAFYHKLVGGYSPAKLEIMQDLIDVHMAPGKGFNSAVLNMLNTKYVIVPGAGGKGEGIIPNPGALGNGWFVSEIKYVPTADDQMRAMTAPQIGDTAAPSPTTWDPRRTAVIRTSFQKSLGNLQPRADSGASVRLSRYGLNTIEYATQNSASGLAVFSDIWYPYGWKAFVDGKETPIVCANYVLRAVAVPAGAHKVEFRFEPATHRNAGIVATGSSIALIAFIIGGIVWAFRNRSHGDHAVSVDGTIAPAPPAPEPAKPRPAKRA